MKTSTRTIFHAYCHVFHECRSWAWRAAISPLKCCGHCRRSSIELAFQWVAKYCLAMVDAWRSTGSCIFFLFLLNFDSSFLIHRCCLPLLLSSNNVKRNFQSGNVTHSKDGFCFTCYCTTFVCFLGHPLCNCPGIYGSVPCAGSLVLYFHVCPWM